MRLLVISAVVIGGLLVGGNQVAENVGESALSTALAKSVAFEGDVEVEFVGGPILIGLLTGSIDGVRISASKQRLKGLSFSKIEVMLRDLTLDGSVFGSGPLAVAVDKRVASAWTGAKALNEFLRARGQDAKVVLGDRQVTVIANRTIAGARRQITATGPLVVDGTELRFVAKNVTWEGPKVPGAQEAARRAASFREQLPVLPGGLKITNVRVTPDEMRFAAVGSAQSYVVR